MGLFYETDWHCSKDAIKYTSMLEKERVFDFLQVLNSGLDEVRGRLLGLLFLQFNKHLPRSGVRKVAKRWIRSLLLAHNQTWILVDQITMANMILVNDGLKLSNSLIIVIGLITPRRLLETSWQARLLVASQTRFTTLPICYSTCSGIWKISFRLIFQPNKLSCYNNFWTRLLFSKVSDTSLPPSSTVDVAQRSNNIIFLLSHTVSKDNWIVDTDALHDMTGLPMFLPRMRLVLMVWMFQLLMVPHLMFPVLAMLIFLGWLLTSVLHVLSFPSSLLYVSKLTKDLNCAVTFFPSHYEFEDLTLGRMIGSAEKGTAYIISVVLVPLCQRSLPNVSFSVVSEFDVMLWHKRLGHPSFIYLKTLYPHLVIIKDFSLRTLYLC